MSCAVPRRFESKRCANLLVSRKHFRNKEDGRLRAVNGESVCKEL